MKNDTLLLSHTDINNDGLICRKDLCDALDKITDKPMDQSRKDCIIDSVSRV